MLNQTVYEHKNGPTSSNSSELYLLNSNITQKRL
jgi:hypothetical protein